MLLKKVLFLTIVFVSHVSAEMIVTDAQKFAIVEETPLVVIEKKLKEAQQSGKLESLQEELVERVRHSVLNPPPVLEIGRAQQTRSWTYDPSFTVSKDLSDHKGNVFAKKGQRINPLETVPFGDPFIFIDGDDEDQVYWAISQPGDIVLTKGSPTHLSQKYERPFFFDQGGSLTKKFSIKNVPAYVRQEKKVLVVEEVAL